jgi:leader peptidase (prepilin peptidase) / N-methyltransferase
VAVLNSIDEDFFRFVTRGEPAAHSIVFVALGLLCGLFVARWSGRMVRTETAGEVLLSRSASYSLVALTALLFPALILAMIYGECQSITEGGSINWAQWRLLYQQALIALLIVATAVDLGCYLIPDTITLPGVLTGLGVATLLGNMQLIPVWVDWNQLDPITGPYIPEWIKNHPHWHGLAVSAAGLVTGASLTWLARQVSFWVLRVESLGFGDVTLMAMIGSFLGWQPVVFVFLIAPACGIVAGVTLKLVKGRRVLPYGPCLAAAAVIVLFTWKWLWTSTREVFGHWPTLAGLAALVVGGMAILLGLLRLYRAIPVTRS